MSRLALLLAVVLAVAGVWYLAEQRDGAPSGRAVKVGTPVTGTLAATDLRLRNRGPYQLWSLKGKRGQKLTITMTSSSFDTFIYLRTAEGLAIGGDDDSGENLNARLNTILPRTGTYVIVAGSVGSRSQGDYTLTVAPWLVPEAPGAGAVHGIAAGETLDGLLEPGDDLTGDGPYQDRWTVEAEAGTRLRAEMRSSDLDSYLIVLGPDGAVVGSNDDAGGRDAALSFRAEAAGRYVLLATTFGDQPRAGAYRVALSELSGNVGDPGVPVAIAVGEAKSGALEGGDSVTAQGSFADVYTFRAAAAGGVLIDVTSGELDPVVTLQDSTGRQLARDDDGGEGTNARLTYGVSAGTLYRVVVGTFGSTARSGAYEIRLSPGVAAPAFTK